MNGGVSLSSDHAPCPPALEGAQQGASSLPASGLGESVGADCAAPPSGKDFEDLRMAISQLRAERRAQRQQQPLQTRGQGSLLQEPGGSAASEGAPGERGGEGPQEARAAEPRAQRNGTASRASEGEEPGEGPGGADYDEDRR